MPEWDGAVKMQWIYKIMGHCRTILPLFPPLRHGFWSGKFGEGAGASPRPLVKGLAREALDKPACPWL